MPHNDSAKELAGELLDIGAVKLSPESPFTWASGWKSPIYCDNRKILSYPVLRTAIRDRFAAIAGKEYPQAEVIAGVATGGIAIGALVADALHLPFVYVRSSQKGHGLGNQVEGVAPAGKQVVVIEDLISTGASSLKAVKALRASGASVMGMLAIFTYEFDIARQGMHQQNCPLTTLSGYSALLEEAMEKGAITVSQKSVLETWRKSPDTWRPQ